jgi:hypothetical protein
MFCTYLTFYKGAVLPPFYIGYAKSERLKQGYLGSVSSKKYQEIWKREIKEHPEFFKITPITFHQTKNEAVAQEAKFHRQFQVDINPLYINQSISSERYCGYPKGTYSHNTKTREKIKEARAKQTITKESRQKFIETMKGRDTRKEKIVTCSVCGKTGQTPIMYRWHFDNCDKKQEGNKWSEEWKAKQSVRMTEWHKNRKLLHDS